MVLLGVTPANLHRRGFYLADMMKHRVRKQSNLQILFAFLGTTVALGALAGCKPAAPPVHEDGASAPATAETPAPLAENEVPSDALKAPVAILPPTPPPPAKPDATELERQFFASTDPAARGAVAEQLWELNTPPALATLQRLFNADASVDVKVDIVSGLIDAEPSAATRDLRWALLLTALSANQPSAVREVAVQILTGSEDPRALPVLQNFASDANEEVREAVAAALAERREAGR